MKEQSEENTKKEVIEKKTIRIFRGHLFIKLVIILLLVLAVIAGIAGLRKGSGQPAESESKTTRIGFENIGQMVTQAAYCTEMNVTKDSRKLFGMTIPFTQSEYIYSYDGIVKAGLDFSQIEVAVNDEAKIATVKLPEIKVLDVTIDNDSLKIYDESQSIFTPLHIEDLNNAQIELKAKAKETALENDLIGQAAQNAKTIISGFLSGTLDLKDYTIEFEEQKGEGAQ